MIDKNYAVRNLLNGSNYVVESIAKMFLIVLFKTIACLSLNDKNNCPFSKYVCPILTPLFDFAKVNNCLIK